jgi:hypothetical protein
MLVVIPAPRESRLPDAWLTVRKISQSNMGFADILAAPSAKTIYDLNTQCCICNMQGARTRQNLRYTTLQSPKRKQQLKTHSAAAYFRGKRSQQNKVGRATLAEENR